MAGVEEEYSQEESLGGKIKDELAKVVRGHFTTKLSNELLKKRLDAHLRPENCEALVAPSVNREIWQQLPARAKKVDVGLAQLQRCVVKAASAITYTVNEMIQVKDIKSADTAMTMMKRNCTDALALLGHASRDLSMRRRSAIRPHINRSLHRLCDRDTVPVTTKLFGDDLASSLRDMKELEKLNASLHPSVSRFPPKPFNNFFGKTNFLGSSRGGGRMKNPQWTQRRNQGQKMRGGQSNFYRNYRQ